MNWDAYFPMPNDRNKERLNYYIDKRLSMSDNSLYKEILLLSKNIINDIPEKYLCKAFINYDYTSSILLWSNSHDNLSSRSFSIEYNMQGFEEGKIFLLLWKFNSTEESDLLSMTMMGFIKELNYESYEEFMKILFTELKIYYE